MAFVVGYTKTTDKMKKGTPHSRSSNVERQIDLGELLRTTPHVLDRVGVRQRILLQLLKRGLKLVGC
jgi:hypothetical protein